MNKRNLYSRTCCGTRVIASAVLLIASLAIPAVAQTPAADTTHSGDTYQTLYLSNLTQESDANQLSTALRNMLPNSRLFYVPSQGAMSFRGSAEDLALARKILADLDKTKKIYRLTYTVTEKEEGKIVGVQHFSIIVASGTTTDFKQGSRVPVEVGRNAVSGGGTEVTYLDVGEEINVSLDGYLDGVRLRSKVVQSSVVEDKSAASTLPPVIRQATLEGTSTLVQGKPLVLGSLDVPGSTRHQEIEVVSELVH